MLISCLVLSVTWVWLMSGQNHIKGYIARNRGIVVLARTGVFPGTGI